MIGEWGKCPSCGERGFIGSNAFDHRCKAAWECRPAWSDGDDDWQEVRADDAESAATKFAERYDCEGGDYAIVSNRIRGDIVIQVRKPGEETFERWEITAETVPAYYASKVDDE